MGRNLLISRTRLFLHHLLTDIERWNTMKQQDSGLEGPGNGAIAREYGALKARAVR